MVDYIKYYICDCVIITTATTTTKSRIITLWAIIYNSDNILVVK